MLNIVLTTCTCRSADYVIVWRHSDRSVFCVAHKIRLHLSRFEQFKYHVVSQFLNLKLLGAAESVYRFSFFEIASMIFKCAKKIHRPYYTLY